MTIHARASSLNNRPHRDRPRHRTLSLCIYEAVAPGTTPTPALLKIEKLRLHVDRRTLSCYCFTALSRTTCLAAWLFRCLTVETGSYRFYASMEAVETVLVFQEMLRKPSVSSGQIKERAILSAERCPYLETYHVLKINIWAGYAYFQPLCYCLHVLDTLEGFMPNLCRARWCLSLAPSHFLSHCIADPLHIGQFLFFLFPKTYLSTLCPL